MSHKKPHQVGMRGITMLFAPERGARLAERSLRTANVDRMTTASRQASQRQLVFELADLALDSGDEQRVESSRDFLDNFQPPSQKVFNRPRRYAGLAGDDDARHAARDPSRLALPGDQAFCGNGRFR